MIKARKKAMICFYKGNINDDMHILEELDSKGFEVHLFNDIDETNLKYDILFYIIKDLYGTNSTEYDIYISSNIKEFIMLEYILYKNCISGALYLNYNPVYGKMDELYSLILGEKINIETSNFYLMKDEENTFNNYCVFNGDFQPNLDNNKIENVVYTYVGTTHVLNVKNGKNIEIINLDNSKKTKDYEYHLELDYLDEYIKLIDYYSNSTEEFIRVYQIVYSELDKLKIKILNLPDFEKNMAQFKLDNCLYDGDYSDKHKIFLSSVLFSIYNEKKYMEFLLELLIESTSIDKYNRFFCYYQCVRYIFVSQHINDENIDMLIEKLYEKIFDEFMIIGEKYSKVPKRQRDDNMVFVVVSQFLSINHAPTKIALDVCYNLMKNLNKRVVLINTVEVVTLKGIIPMSNIVTANGLNQHINTIEYKDIKIPFYQPEVQMPDDNEIVNILNMLEKYKPGLIINIGTTLVGDLCTKIIPTVTIPLGVNGYSKSTFYVINNETDYREYRNKHNRNKETFIITKAQFDLKSKEYTFNKEEMGIPKNKFILAVIGNRLNKEIDEEFLEVLEKSCKFNNAYVLFISNFDFNELQSIKYKNLINNYKNMGYQEDLLAVLENIDVYVNPRRNGGGTSAIYALYLGKPVVTLNCGDVETITGKEFLVDDYNMMSDKISEYHNNNIFYNKQSDIARKKALEITDMSKYIKDIYIKVTKNKLY